MTSFVNTLLPCGGEANRLLQHNIFGNLDSSDLFDTERYDHSENKFRWLLDIHALVVEIVVVEIFIINYLKPGLL